MSRWPTAALQEVADIERNVVHASAIEDGTPYVGLENIASGGEFVDLREVERGELASSKFSFSPEHVLFGKLRPYLAKIARPEFAGVCSTDILPILPRPSLDRGYLSHFLLRPESIAWASSRATGANLPRLSPRILAGMRLPLPPLSEQRRIAEVLDRAEALRAKRRAALAQLDTLTQSIFLEMFGDPVTNPKGWPLKRIGEFAKVVTGNTPPREIPEYYGSAIEWIKSDNVNTPHYFLTKAAEGLSESGMAVARTAPAGSILITCIAGSPDCIGNSAMADREVAFNQQINAVEPRIGDAHFLYAQIRLGKRLVQAATTGGMKGMVSKGRLEQVKLMFPALELQRELAIRLSAAAACRDCQVASQSELDELFSSLQHRAFRGEL